MKLSSQNKFNDFLNSEEIKNLYIIFIHIGKQEVFNIKL